MFKNKKLTANRLYNTLAVIASILVAICIIRGIIITTAQYENQTLTDAPFHSISNLDDLNEDWTLTYADGHTEQISIPCTIDTADETITITKDITGLFDNGDVLQFDNNRHAITVSADDTLLYQVNTTVLSRQILFTDYQIVALPDVSTFHTLTMTYSAFGKGPITISDIIYGPRESIKNTIITNELLTLIFVVILALFCVATVSLSIFSYVRKYIDYRLVDLSIFILLAIFWGLTDSYLPVLSAVPQEVLGLISYLSLMALPLPIGHFVWYSCQKSNRMLPAIIILGAINLIAQCLLSLAGLIQLNHSFFSAHVIIILVVIAAIINIYQNRRKSEKNIEMDILYAGIIILAIVTIIAIVVYWKLGGQYYRNSMLIAIQAFVVLLFFSVVFHYARELHQDQLRLSEIKIHERLAMYDELTGLMNRRSFERKLEEIEKDTESKNDAILIMMDVNGLKIVNDNYGHAAGDDLIVAAARSVQAAYEPDGFCYRIGGDEFVVILTSPVSDLSVYENKLDQVIENNNKNTRWKLSIARGTAHLQQLSGQRLSISDWKQEADVNMYRNKVSMAGPQNRDHAKDLTDILDCIITTVEAKDLYTAAHSDRVRELSHCIAANLGVSDSTIRNIESAAHMHDIGKISIPDHILLKPAALTDEEYDILKQHSTIGAKIIGSARGMQEISDIILHHHERWDGNGYPSGLSRDAIPLESRIIAIADSIDAMTSKRCYRDSMSIDSCKEEIIRNAGIMYDPAIVKIVLEHWNEITDIILLHPKRLVQQNVL